MDRRPRRWALWGLSLYLLFAAVVLLAPVSFGEITKWIAMSLNGMLGFDWIRGGMVEFAANVVLFVPLGLLLTLSAQRVRLGMAFALVISAAAELAQLVLPSRVTSVRDVLANVVGAAIGGLLALAIRWAQRRADEHHGAASATGADRPPTPELAR